MSVRGHPGPERSSEGRGPPEPSRDDAAWLIAYEHTHGNAQRAREVWAEVVAAGEAIPALALCCGATVASIFVERVALPTFCVRATGGSPSLRRAVVAVAIAAAGEPDELILPADGALAARRAVLASILPIALEADTDRSVIEAVLDASGASRLTVVTAGDEAGPSRSDVIDVPMRTADDSDLTALAALAAAHAGWPLNWLAWSPVIEQVGGWYERSRSALAGPAASAGVAIEPLALCAVGYGLLARLTGAADAGFVGVVPALKALEGR